MKEDRDLRAQAQDQPIGDERFGLRQRARAGILLIARSSSGTPAVGKVAIEIDAAGVLACVGGGPVGVQVIQDPQIDAPRDGHGVQATGNGDPRALVPMDATHDEDSTAGDRIP
jgi:hypothetical protein